ncbi:MAG: ParA family protein [Spirochaetaceae bacterium]|nr:ParA family protein [Spirochaetaceae bacterium]
METNAQSGPKVITLSANKGGVGKTRMAILIANCLGASGRQVLVMDMDFNNSASFYYLSPEHTDIARTKNIADGLSRETNNLADYALTTDHPGVHLLASSRYLADLRSINEKRLSRMTGLLSGLYDVILVDCQPDYNNLTLNALNAADLIITPVLKDLDSYNAACFLGQKIALDTDKYDAWHITINGYNHQYEAALSGKQKEYLDIYKNEFQRITDPATWFPWTADMNEIKDRKKLLSGQQIRGAVQNPELYQAVIKLSEFCIQDELLERPAVF